jgi:hypothetical protein
MLPCRKHDLGDDQAKKVLDFVPESTLNTSLMHSDAEPAGFFPPLGSIFQVIDL